ncbi:dipeptide epimerase [Rubinisphaera brasiliensis]|uniref:Dipeptide epimerase n=1 Tax=Rubinisphaera brasiliensis (strain ATCC 49424 / DSM 5305 / JCM 21570 / IAM 15109 / NBRC 103401 / IFAM 1448) TaxID=756272 RepID=F0SIY9_RUBBR|nr:dipeptide epimerase [Rubinisphaera brasiliensis]ADY61838.1 Mandelate racemase/muconate lactonizing protein [Rubinisphaera brasiliensis DSM 5305]
MKLQTHRFELPLEHPFTIARGTRHVQRSLIVELEHEGVRGYGEATEHAYYGVSIDEMEAALDDFRPAIEAFKYCNPRQLWAQLQPRLAEQMFLLAAIDCAAHDLFGKLSNRPTFTTLGLSWRNIPLSSFTIGIDSTERMVEKMEARDSWPIFKIKLGTDRDIEIIRELRQHTAATFRVDANCGWSAAETVENSKALAELGVEFIEQPLPADASTEDLRIVYEHSALPIIADESCLTEPDVDRCHGLFHGINLKLSKCGGITPGYRMLKRARELGMQTMIGCMVESTVGISAAAQLLPLLDYADLDGAELLAGDAADGVTLLNGHITPAMTCGNGIDLLAELAH